MKREQKIEQYKFEIAQIQKQIDAIISMSGDDFSAIKSVIEGLEREIINLKKEMKVEIYK